MKGERLYLDYLHDILDNAVKAIEFSAGMTADQFFQDEKTVFAVIRAIEIVGEATKKIPEQVRHRYKFVPWREMAGTRDILVHDYFGVNLQVIWKTVSDDLPSLIPLLHEIIRQETE